MPKRQSLEDRFWDKVDIRGEDDCWEWKAGTFQGRYGKFRINGKFRGAHRVSWIITQGEIPDGLCVCHDCPGGDNPFCCNPKHLYLGTTQENTEDRDRKGRQSRGSEHWCSKLNENAVASIRKRHALGGVTQAEIAREYGVSRTIICSIVKGKQWRHVELQENNIHANG